MGGNRDATSSDRPEIAALQVDKATGSGERSHPLRKLAMWGIPIVGTVVITALTTDIFAKISGEIKTRTSDPVKIVVDTEPATFGESEPPQYFLPVSPENLDAPPQDCLDRAAWVKDHGGSDANVTRVMVTLIGNRTTEVSVQDIEPEIINRSARGDGIVAACRVGGGSGEVRELRIDLGTETRQPSTIFYDLGESKPIPRLTLAEGETEAIRVTGATRGDGAGPEPVNDQLIEWRLHVVVVADGKTHELVVDDGGEPFRTAGTEGLARYEFTDDSWESIQ